MPGRTEERFSSIIMTQMAWEIIKGISGISGIRLRRLTRLGCRCCQCTYTFGPVSWQIENNPINLLWLLGRSERTYGSSRAGIAVGEVKTFAHVGPGNALVTGDGEQLVGVSGQAGVNLHLDVVGGGAVGDI
jgi:hypothetical protein